MLILLKEAATKEEIVKASTDIEQYIKFVVDIITKDVTIGGDRHFQGEQLLLGNGAKQKDLWGGGYDLGTKMVDYDSMINIRPRDDNPSREVLNMDVRKEIDKILKEKLKW